MSGADGLDEAATAALARTLLTDIPDAVIYADSDGVVRFWNGGATRIFGFSAEEALGQSLDIIIPERLRQRHWTGFDHMMKTGRAGHPADALLAVPATTKSGDTLSIQFTVAPVHADGALAGIIAVLRDVTDTFREIKRLRAEASGR